jgi:tetratricopeptide (TPR) repeat protein
MKKLLVVIVIISICSRGTSQESKSSASDELLKQLSDNACKCIDSITAYNRSKDEITAEISKCIQKQAGAYQMGAKLMNVDKLAESAEIADGKKQVNITVNTDENSDEYKKYYYELERYMMSNCAALKERIASNDKVSAKSFSLNPKATEYYSKGLDAAKKENYKKAVDYFEKAVKEDPEFAFAWDNLGVNYRRLGDFDKAIECYEKSLQIDPNGLMPLQNIPIAYQYKKEYAKAIAAYQRLAEIDKNNPEVFYGIGNVYVTNLKEYEKGLDYLCKAYNMYVEQKSPYRADAEQLIGYVYGEMKKLGNEEKFNEILKANNISQQ